MRARTALPWLLLAALSACGRTYPSTLPPSSATSVDAEEAPAAVVGRALREEPPLPGESTEGWEALERAPSSAAHHHGHEHGPEHGRAHGQEQGGHAHAR